MDEKEGIIKLLDDYYGDFRSDDFKEEVAEFIEREKDWIMEILK